eukprot:jgi/Astpho2/5998/fgenesh1_pm.00084_%23_5_t
MILMSDTGGGHRASADAIKAGFHILYGDKFEFSIVDLWSDHTPWPYNQIPKSYSFLVKNSFLWRFGYYTQQPRFVHRTSQRLACPIVRRRINEAYDLYQPDLVVSVHPLMQMVPLQVLRERVRAGVQKPTKFATVVTDLTTCHNTWFHPRVDQCFVATQEARRRAMRMGLKDHQITVHGLPIRPAFSQKLPAKRKLRRQLGMDLDKPAVLLVGGGEGMGPVERTVTALAQQVGAACQVVVICGRNKRLVRRLEARQYPEGMKVVVTGFVHNMPEWMSASDMIITKAGPGTIAESLICGLPVLLNAFIPCQEEGNVTYVLDNKVGTFEQDPQKIAGIIRSWVQEKRVEFDEMAARAKQIAQPDALFRIVRDLAAMCAA